MSTGTYIVVLYAQAGARFESDDHLHLADVPVGQGKADLIFRTDYVEEGFASPVPRSMWVEVAGSADSLDEALNVLGPLGHGFGPMIALATNAYVGDLEAHIAYDLTQGRTEREFFQSFIPSVIGMPTPGRVVWVDGAGKLIEAFSASSHRRRLDRAAGQYVVALGYWRPEFEILALAHLYMGMEAMTPVAVRREAARRGLTEDDLCADLGFENKHQLAVHIRKTVLFDGDDDTYRVARRASDEFEHGLEDFDSIRKKAAQVRDRTAFLLRKAIIEASDLDPSVAGKLLTPPYDTPQDWFGYARYFRGTLVGEVGDLAAPDKQYPMLVLKQGMKRFERLPNGKYHAEFKVDITPLLAEGVVLGAGSMQIWGPGGSDPGSIEFDGVARTDTTAEDGGPIGG